MREDAHRGLPEDADELNSTVVTWVDILLASLVQAIERLSTSLNPSDKYSSSKQALSTTDISDPIRAVCLLPGTITSILNARVGFTGQSYSISYVGPASSSYLIRTNHDSISKSSAYSPVWDLRYVQ